MEGQQ